MEGKAFSGDEPRSLPSTVEKENGKVSRTLLFARAVLPQKRQEAVLRADDHRPSDAARGSCPDSSPEAAAVASYFGSDSPFPQPASRASLDLCARWLHGVDSLLPQLMRAPGTQTWSPATPARSDCRLVVDVSSLRLIGRGGFGTVYAASAQVGNGRVLEVAIKEVEVRNGLRRKVEKETEIMRLLSNHPNVVLIKTLFYTSTEMLGRREHGGTEYINIIMEYLPATLAKLHGENLSLAHAHSYSCQLFQALSHIHEMGICHRDVTPANVLVNPASGIVKLCDFGSAKMLDPDKPNGAQPHCALIYRAPERLLLATTYTTAVDMWSAGCVLAQLLRLGQPIIPMTVTACERTQLVEIAKLIGKPSLEEVNKMNPGCPYPLCYDRTNTSLPASREEATWASSFVSAIPAEAIDLASKLLVYAPDQRLTAQEARQHPFYTSNRVRRAM